MKEHTNIEQAICDKCETNRLINGFEDLEELVNNPFCEKCNNELLDNKDVDTINKVLELHKHAMVLSDKFTLESIYVGFDSEGLLHLTVSVEN